VTFKYPHYRRCWNCSPSSRIHSLQLLNRFWLTYCSSLDMWDTWSCLISFEFFHVWIGSVNYLLNITTRRNNMGKYLENEVAINHNLQPFHQSVKGFYGMFGIMCRWRIVLEMSRVFICHFLRKCLWRPTYMFQLIVSA
jgi:hypothetical protein